MRTMLISMMLLGCGNVEQSRVEYRTPDPATFPEVADAIAPTCATLDCHGQVGRNFRIYWQRGLRLSPDARPGEGETTSDEYLETYRSIVGLEPIKLDAVLRGTVTADRLMVVRKGRGIEKHKGEAQLAPGSAADRCLLSWLSGTMDSDACARAVAPAGSP